MSRAHLAMSEAELKWLVRYLLEGGKARDLSYPWQARIAWLRSSKPRET